MHSSVDLPTATKAVFADICQQHPAGLPRVHFPWLLQIISLLIWMVLFCKWLVFVVFLGLWALPRGHLPCSGEIGREFTDLDLCLLPWSSQRLFLPHSIWLRNLINYRCIHRAFAWGRKREMIPPNGMISGREGGRRLGYTIGKNAVKSCHQ